VTPPAEEVVQKDDHLVVIGRDEDVDYLDEKMNG
jgi:trk system potassium uptake protein TrkA